MLTTTGDVIETQVAEVPAWHGVLYAARGNCDPHRGAAMLDMGAVLGPTPSNLTPSIARCVKFRPPATINVATVHLFAVAASSAVSRFAIYRAGDRVLVWDSGVTATATNAWLSFVTNFILAANANHWFSFSVSANGSTASFRTPPAPLSANQWGTDTAPLGDNDLGLPVLAQFAVTNGVFPAVMPALTAAAYAGGATGSVPVAFLSAV
ncbi:MAG: hypothetical protein MSG64_07495 [Pyrinomonadaceae bacterium MAG19_C2-C3]|nr:hypothetical protein [Pyrinomonadaceae bacterium MAG19_C2-C3]